MSISEAVRAWLLAPLLEQLSLVSMTLQNQHKEILKTMAIDQAQVDTDLATLGSNQTASDTTLAQLLALVQQIIAKAQSGGVDLTNEDTAINAIAADIATQQASQNAAIASIQAALGTQPPTPSAQVKK